MFNKDELKRAVRTQQRTYRLLKWMNSAMDKGFISPETAHEYTTASEVAQEWIEKHFYNLPDDGRPERYDKEEIEAYANMLSTYLLTSFEIDEQPGKLLKSDCGCYCQMCSYLIAAPHLRTKKLKKEDKNRAKKLKIDYLKKLDIHYDTHLDDTETRKIAEDSNLRETLSMATYGYQLILRVQGHVEGPAILALWRDFAWNVKGSPKKNFKLNVANILQCEERLIQILTG